MASISTPSARRSAKRTRAPAGGGGLAIFAKVFALGLLVALGWAVVTQGLSEDALWRRHPADALAYDPGSAPAAAGAAQEKLIANKSADAVALGRQAVRNSPLSVVGLRNLGLALASANDSALSGQVMSYAAALSWRDIPTQAWLIAAAAHAGDYAGAALHVDALVRARGLTDETQGIVDNLAANPQAREAMVDRLVQRPKWRELYFANSFDVDPERAQLRSDLLMDIVQRGAPIERSEMTGVLQGLIKGNTPEQGYDLWRRVTGTPAGTVFDPGFRRVQPDANTAVPFEWYITPVVGATAAVETDNGRQAVHVSSDGTSSGPLIREFVALAPGPHHLVATARFSNKAAGDAFRLQLSCVRPGMPYFRSTPSGGQTVLDVTVPPGDLCPVQALEIAASHVDSSGLLEAWFDGVTGS